MFVSQGIVRKKARLEKNEKLSAAERQEEISGLTMDGCPIEVRSVSDAYNFERIRIENRIRTLLWIRQFFSVTINDP